MGRIAPDSSTAPLAIAVFTADYPIDPVFRIRSESRCPMIPERNKR